MKNFNIADYQGTHTALITPFSLKGEFDLRRFREQIKFQIAGGIQGIVPVGTTGESPTLSHAEHVKIIQDAVRIAEGQVKVIAGTGSNSTDEAIHLTQSAEKVRADASLQVVPYYNKPTQDGLFAHFQAIAKKTKLPIILYNIPSRCGVEITVETVGRLVKTCPNVIGIKEAGGSSERVTELRRRFGPKFLILSGDDSLTVPFCAVGADGAISVLSNILPQHTAFMGGFIRGGDVKSAMETHLDSYPLIKAIFREGNPAGVKCAMKLLGRDSGYLRPPLLEVSKATRQIIRKELSDFDLL